jgi:hypothetical protein
MTIPEQGAPREIVEGVECIALHVRPCRCSVKHASNHELHDLDPATDADLEVVPSNK